MKKTLLTKLSEPLCILAAITLTISFSIKTLYGQSLRPDEAHSLCKYTKSLSNFIYSTEQNVHTPLYGTILHFWLQIFSNSIIAARSLSLLLFVLCVPALYILA